MLMALAASCSSHDSVENKLNRMRSSSVQLCLDSMDCWLPDSQKGCFSVQSPFKMVVYSDTSDCSMCYIRQLELWNEYLSIEEKYNGRFSILFIMEVRSGEMASLRENLLQCGLNHPIYLDNKFLFRRHNPQIPEEEFFHCFLMQNDSVLLVGNPLKNEKVDELLKKVLSERLGTDKNKQSE